jgi:hypothetical protein
VTTAETVKAARRVSTPILAIATADQWATIAGLVAGFDKATPMLQWDCARGFLPNNERGAASLKAIMPKDSFPGTTPGLNLTEALNMAMGLPERSILFLLNAQLFWNEPGVIQGVLNTRDLFKQDQRTLILLAPIVRLPLEFQQDCMVIDEPLPTEEQIRVLLTNTVKDAREAKKSIPEPDAADMQHGVEALTGLAAFPIEQAASMSLATAGRLDLDQLWARKRGFVEQTRGLKFDVQTGTLADLGGLAQVKLHAEEIFNGAEPPRAILRLDEIEKSLAGASGPIGDTSGTSQDALGVILREMEDNGWAGMIEVGPPGSGKSEFSKKMGRTFGVPSLELDLGATKGSLVGQSEENIRTAMKVIKAIAGTACYVLGTCNKLESLPPELRRRFTDGIWFFDLPSDDERAPIWTINLLRFGLTGETLADLVEMSRGWTGAEIRNVCRRAYRTRKPIAEAKRYIVPVSVADPDGIEKLRKLAVGKFLSTSHPGTYVHPNDAATPPADAARRRFLEKD